MLGAQDTLGASQIPLLIGEVRGDPCRERRYLETFSARQVDGLIVAGRRPESAQGLRASPAIPVVHALGRAANGGFSALPDVAGGARLAAEHLLGLGRRRIAHITGPESHASARLEASGFAAALRAAGAGRCGPVMHGLRCESWGREAAGRLLPGRPDAIFCGSDQIARGAADTVRALGFRIPDDIAHVGSGNWAPAALGARPELTSVDLCLEEVGRVAAGYLLSAIAGEEPEGVHRVPARLEVRRSSGGGDAGRAPAGPGRTGMPARTAMAGPAVSEPSLAGRSQGSNAASGCDVARLAGVSSTDRPVAPPGAPRVSCCYHRASADLPDGHQAGVLGRVNCVARVAPGAEVDAASRHHWPGMIMKTFSGHSAINPSQPTKSSRSWRCQEQLEGPWAIHRSRLRRSPASLASPFIDGVGLPTPG